MFTTKYIESVSCTDTNPRPMEIPCTKTESVCKPCGKKKEENNINKQNIISKSININYNSTWCSICAITGSTSCWEPLKGTICKISLAFPEPSSLLTLHTNSTPLKVLNVFPSASKARISSISCSSLYTDLVVVCTDSESILSTNTSHRSIRPVTKLYKINQYYHAFFLTQFE